MCQGIYNSFLWMYSGTVSSQQVNCNLQLHFNLWVQFVLRAVCLQSWSALRTTYLLHWDFLRSMVLHGCLAMIFNIPHLRFLRCNPWPLFFKSLSFSLQWIFLIWECTQPMGYFFWKSYSWRIYVICSQIKLMIVTSLIKVVGASNESEEEQLFSSTNLSMNKTLHDQVKVILLYKQKIYIS